MAGTDRSQELLTGGPAFILMRPQLGENIGSAARAMLNFGISDLRLVSPRDPWPNECAIASSSGAEAVTSRARLYESGPQALADLKHVYASSARPRDMQKPILTAEEGARRLREHIAAGETAGVIFGPERTGLTNDDLSLAEAIIEIPANPGFASLNLAHAVLLIGYEWYVSAEQNVARPPLKRRHRRSSKASNDEVVGFFEHLERELDAAGFLYPPEKAPRMVRNLRNLFHRATLTEQDVRTLRGVVKALVEGGPGRFRNKKD